MTTDRRKKIADHANRVFDAYVSGQNRAQIQANSDLLLVFNTLQEFADEVQKIHQQRNIAGRIVPHVFWAHNCVVIEVACQQLIFGEAGGEVYSITNGDPFNRTLTRKEDDDVGLLALQRLSEDLAHVLR